jgi:hypothetical protein
VVVRLGRVIFFSFLFPPLFSGLRKGWKGFKIANCERRKRKIRSGVF